MKPSTLALGDVNEFCTHPNTDFFKAYQLMGARAAIIRATTTGAWIQGKPSLKKDAMFDRNYYAIKQIPMKPYVYSWFDPRTAYVSATEQAEFFLSQVSVLDTHVIDVEPASGISFTAASVNGVKTWLEYVEKYTGRTPYIYTYPSHIATMEGLTDIGWMARYPLIIAHWDVPAAKIPYPWFPGCEYGWQWTAYAPGKNYGFMSADGKTQLRICLASMYDC
jgi:GH25 family lysozyme M1 (1,4-beta-N-acetylmuramidase)